MRTITYTAPILTILLAVSMSKMCAADALISGETKEGLHIEIVDFYETDAFIETWRKVRKGNHSTIDYHSITNYKNEPCIQIRKSPYEPHKIVCSPKGKSPLAGTQYIARRFNGSCEKGDPEFIFTCVAGCGKGTRAPKILKKSYWEC